MFILLLLLLLLLLLMVMVLRGGSVVHCVDGLLAVDGEAGVGIAPVVVERGVHVGLKVSLR